MTRGGGVRAFVFALRPKWSISGDWIFVFNGLVQK